MTSPLKPTPQTVELIKHKDGTGPWISIASQRPNATSVECMGRRGDVCMIPQAMLVGEPYEVPFNEVPQAQQKAYCQRFGFEIPHFEPPAKPVKKKAAPKKPKAGAAKLAAPKPAKAKAKAAEDEDETSGDDD